MKGYPFSSKGHGKRKKRKTKKKGGVGLRYKKRRKEKEMKVRIKRDKEKNGWRRKEWCKHKMSSNPWQLGYFEKKKNWALNNFSFLSLRISTLLWSKNKSSLINWDCLALQIVESLALVVKKKKGLLGWKPERAA